VAAVVNDSNDSNDSNDIIDVNHALCYFVVPQERSDSDILK